MEDRMKIVDTIAEARDAMTVKRVFGEAYEKDGVTIIPAAFVAGGGGGGGDAEGSGGAGFGLTAFPVGAYIIKDGNVTWRPALNINLLIPVALLTLRTIVRVRAKRRR
jgi:uncharacterized spore protein YtfJ